MPSRTLRSSVPGQANATGAAGLSPALANDPAVQAALQRTPEESVALYEANRLKNDQLRAAGVRIPRLPPHVYLGGQEQQSPTPAPAPQTPTLPFAPGIQPAPAPQ